MILIYTEKQTSRVRYIFHIFFGDLLGIDYRLTSDAQHFLTFAGPKLSYGSRPLGTELFIRSAPLLFEEGNKRPVPECMQVGDSKVLFPCRDENSALPFDLFAAGFYLVTRFEEYETLHKDRHGRFIPYESIAYKEGFLDKPVVNRWGMQLKEMLLQYFPDMELGQRSFSFLPTIDIDSAYAYRHKGFWRTTGGYVRSFVQGDLRQVKERYQVIRGAQRDPFDTFDYLMALHKKFELSPYFFILVGDYGKNDKNLSPGNPHFRDLIARLAETNAVGIHPSYASHDHPDRLQKEISRLTAIIHHNVTHSRGHFLRLTLPGTYRNLIASGIESDFTMGYAQEPGFRAGICTPYLFYDLHEERPTPLRIYPFAVMDGTLRDYKNLSPATATETVHALLEEVKAVKGTFITIWHNESLSDQGRWKGWRTVYENMIRDALSP
ncbi:MAG: polysaccharide deacetylase family protein [Lentimicrobiaceae bacterium]|nr:polysaccharide deacetylase family protein [Lentimicrobiaceae bacterium]